MIAKNNRKVFVVLILQKAE